MIQNWKEIVTDKRKKKGYTLNELADRTGISARTLSRILSAESDNYVNLDNVLAIAQALELSMGELFDDGNNAESENETTEKSDLRNAIIKENKMLREEMIKSDKEKKVLFFISLGLVCAIVILFAVDLMIGTQGWFRY